MRALHARGPLDVETLKTTVGGDYWDAHRFDRALALAVSDGLVVRNADGKLQTV